jgi:hypothetical protein
LRKKSIAGFIIAAVSALGVNFVPLEMYLDADFSGETVMIVYALENVAAIILATVFVLLFAPKTAPPEKGKARTRREALQLYLLLAITFSVASGIFLSFFIFGARKAEVAFAEIKTAMIWISAFLALEFVGDFLMLRPLTLFQAELFLNRSLGRVFLLFLCVFVGTFVAFFVESWFILPFIILKTAVDIGEQIKIFTGSDQKAPDFNPLTHDYGGGTKRGRK